MINDAFWDKFYTPAYLFLIDKLPFLFWGVVVLLFLLWVRFLRNRIFDILHPEDDIKTQETNTWYKTPEERARLQEQKQEQESVENCLENESVEMNDVENLKKEDALK